MSYTRFKLTGIAVIIFLITISNSQFIFAQAQDKEVKIMPTTKSLEYGTYMNQQIRKLVGNVWLRHRGTDMYSDSTYQYVLKNELEAFNHIRIVKSDSQKISGDHMNYFGDIRLAKITGTNVVLNNKSLSLYTTVLDYDMEKDEARYYNKGKVIDKENVLISDMGTFYNKQDLFVFIQNVVFTDKKYTIYTDTLEYYTETKIVKFRGATTIIGPDGAMKSNSGEYDSEKKKSKFKGRTVVNMQDFTLSADDLLYDQITKAGIASGNVELYSKKDSITIFGDYGNYWANGGKTKVYPQALMQSVSNKGRDTLFLSADTLLAINDTVKKEKKMFAYHRVKIFDKTMQAICDSMVNNMIDSTITLFKDPVLWSTKNQMRGDTIKIISKDKRMDRILLRLKAFVISQDTMDNFNQVKGKNMVAKFDTNKIRKIDVKEMSECIYYAVEKDSVTTGLNALESEDMQVIFEKSKVKTIKYFKKPKGKLIPIHELKPEDERLKGFKWRLKDRPTKEVVLGKYYIKLNQSKKK
jgi:lipopolysaccharide export system protein LptA